MSVTQWPGFMLCARDTTCFGMKHVVSAQIRSEPHQTRSNRLNSAGWMMLSTSK